MKKPVSDRPFFNKSQISDVIASCENTSIRCSSIDLSHTTDITLLRRLYHHVAHGGHLTEEDQETIEQVRYKYETKLLRGIPQDVEVDYLLNLRQMQSYSVDGVRSFIDRVFNCYNAAVGRLIFSNNPDFFEVFDYLVLARHYVYEYGLSSGGLTEDEVSMICTSLDAFISSLPEVLDKDAEYRESMVERLCDIMDGCRRNENSNLSL